ncbi:endonuclease/exonuclease/phosphatase family protein [Candidatus Saccharibacteria bacterium]|nr:endonuclease/exonuclease/phosphatase family protein [Candidatus Saccharibacteria bacterium]
MRILQLNVWHGRVSGALLDYLSNNSFDVICMQEAVWLEDDDKGVHKGFFVTVDTIKEITGMQYDSRAYNWTVDSFLGHKLYQGNVILSREKIVDEKIIEVCEGSTELKEWGNFFDHHYTAQRVKLESGLNVVNYHGYWQKQPLGNEDTVKAMKNVVPLIKETSGPLVMCGDLNIIYAAPAMRELDFLRDLTEENHVDNTLAGLKFGGKVACDHILVNDQINVSSFQIVDRIVSDHKGLIVEF